MHYCPVLPKFMSAFGVLQTLNERRYFWAWSRQNAVPKRALAVFLAVARVIGLVLPAVGDERPNDPFGNDTAELNKDAPVVGIWDSLKHKNAARKGLLLRMPLIKRATLPINRHACSKAG
jgi:hypothetical protein